jgi:hypothetical protein
VDWVAAGRSGDTLVEDALERVWDDASAAALERTDDGLSAGLTLERPCEGFSTAIPDFV